MRGDLAYSLRLCRPRGGPFDQGGHTPEPPSRDAVSVHGRSSANTITSFGPVLVFLDLSFDTTLV